jgi:hypothetical protein
LEVFLRDLMDLPLVLKLYLSTGMLYSAWYLFALVTGREGYGDRYETQGRKVADDWGWITCFLLFAVVPFWPGFVQMKARRLWRERKPDSVLRMKYWRRTSTRK